MSALVIDTSSWISYFAGRGSDLVDRALEDARVHLPPVVAAELVSAKMSARQYRQLVDLLNDLPLCHADLDHWLRVGKLRRRLFERGVSISTPDAHIAQCALDLDADLLTEDRAVRRIADAAPLRLV